MSADSLYQRLVWLGCGDLAAQFISLLTDKNKSNASQRVGVRRNSKNTPSGFVPMAGDLAESVTWFSILRQEQPDAWVISLTPRQRSEAGYHDGYCLPLQQLGVALQQTSWRPKRVIFVSSTSVYGQNNGASVDEDSSTQPSRYNGQQLVCAENILRGLPWGEDTQISCLRLGGIYGQGRSRLLKKIVSAKNCNDLGELNHMTNRVHSVDAARMIAHLLSVEYLRPIYIGCDTGACRQGEIFLWLAETMQKMLPQSPNLGLLIDKIKKKNAMSGDFSGKLCNPTALKKEGFVWEYPSFREGYLPLINTFCQALAEKE